MIRKYGKIPRAQSTDNQPCGIYVHLPFCRRRCAYCDFYSTTDASQVDLYASAVCRHITEAARHANRKCDTVYFGGGTPTVVSAATLCKILKTIKRRWNLDRRAELTLEANPESCGLQSLKRLRRAGFNRLSLGVQSMDDGELESLGRLHSADDALRAFKDARAAGFANISVDLMYGFEGQTADSLRRSLDAICALRPEHISAYALTVEDGTPLAARGFSPDPDAQADMYAQVCTALKAAGFSHYEVSNWAQSGYESRHNSRYWELLPYIGFGPSAHSDLGGSRFACVSDLSAYISGIESGGEILSESERVSDAERAFEYVMLSLRTSRGIDFNELRRRRLDPSPAASLFEKLVSDGLAQRTNNGIRLTENGWLVSNTLILQIAEAMPPLRGWVKAADS